MRRILSFPIFWLSIFQIKAVFTSAQTASITKSAVNSVSTDTDDPSVCTACGYLDEGYQVFFVWPLVTVLPTVKTVATLVYLADSSSRITGSTLRYSNTTEAIVAGKYTTNVITDATSYWKYALDLPDVTVINNTPTAVYTATIPTAAGEFITITTALVSPTRYVNYGFIVTSIGPGTASTTVTELTTVTAYTTVTTAMTTAIKTWTERTYNVMNTTMSGNVCVTRVVALSASNYQIPLDSTGWHSLLQQNTDMKTCTYTTAFYGHPGDGQVQTTATINLVSSLTATTTEYDMFQASQNTAASGSPKAGEATVNFIQTSVSTSVNSIAESTSSAQISALSTAIDVSTHTTAHSTSLRSFASPKSDMASTPSPGQTPAPFTSSDGQMSRTTASQYSSESALPQVYSTSVNTQVVVISDTTITSGTSSVTINSITYGRASGDAETSVSSSDTVLSDWSVISVTSSSPPAAMTTDQTMMTTSPTTATMSTAYGPDDLRTTPVTEYSTIQSAPPATKIPHLDDPATLIVNGQTFTAVATGLTTAASSSSGYGSLIWVGIGGTEQSSTSVSPITTSTTTSQSLAVPTNLQTIVSDFQGTGAESHNLDKLKLTIILVSIVTMSIAVML